MTHLKLYTNKNHQNNKVVFQIVVVYLISFLGVITYTPNTILLGRRKDKI